MLSGKSQFLIVQDLRLRDSTVHEHVTAVDAFRDLAYIEEPSVYRTNDLAKVEQIIGSADFIAKPTPLKTPHIGKLKMPFKGRMWKYFWRMIWLRVYSMSVYFAFGLLVWIGIRFSSKDPSRYNLRTVLLRWPLAWIKIYGVLKDR